MECFLTIFLIFISISVIDGSELTSDDIGRLLSVVNDLRQDNAKLQQDFEKLREQQTVYVERVEKMKQQNAITEEKLRKQQTVYVEKVEKLQQQNTITEENFRKQQTVYVEKIEKLQQQNTITEENLRKQQIEHEQLRKTTGELQTRIDGIESDISNQHASTDEEGSNLIAFSVYPGGGSDYYSANDTIVFQGIIYNNRDAYNSSTGIFTCIESGVYLFTLTVTTLNKIEVALQHESIVKIYTLSWETSGVYSQASNTMLLYCNAGERVWAHVINTVPDQAYVQPNGYTIFSGVKIS